MADCKIARRRYVGIAGSHIRSFNSHRHGGDQGQGGRARSTSSARSRPRARSTSRPTSRSCTSCARNSSSTARRTCASRSACRGVRLEVKVHIVTGAVSAAQNIIKCVRRCGLEVHDLILQPLASARAVLSEDEKDLGVCLLDIGGGTTDIAIFTHGAIRHTAVIPIAGDQITNDIAMALRTPTADAEDDQDAPRRGAAPAGRPERHDRSARASASARRARCRARRSPR